MGRHRRRASLERKLRMIGTAQRRLFATPEVLRCVAQMADEAVPMAIDSSTAIAVDPTALARFGRLELVARLVVEGVMAGLHKSPFKGFSVEFAEHRQYGPGDEIRHIDWRAFGKTDRYYVKEYEEETNLKAYLVVDSSGSMGYAGRTVSKFEHARRLAASLAYLMISQRDAVGLVTFDGEVRGHDPAAVGPGPLLGRSARCWRRREAGGETPLSGILHALAERIQPARAGRRPLRRVRPARRADRGAAAPAAPPPRGPLPPHPGPRGGGVPVPPPGAVPQPRAPRPRASGSTPRRSARPTSSGSGPSAGP